MRLRKNEQLTGMLTAAFTLAVLGITLGCKSYCDPASVAKNRVPAVSIISPTNKEIILASEALILANAFDSDGTISNVKFFVDASEIAEESLPPYSFLWKAHPGHYVITVKAIDDQGASATSRVEVTVQSSSKLR